MHIWNIEQLRELDTVSRKHDVSFKIHGGVAFRYARKVEDESLDSDGLLVKPFELFDLAPFSSDIDIVHSGPSKKNATVFESIQKLVPYADCFRWELRSQAEQALFDKLKPQGNRIPARSLSISNIPLQPIHDPLGGRADIKNRSYRYIRHPSFADSRLFKDGRDLEVFSALLYLQTLFEADLEVVEIANQPGISDVETIFSSCNENILLTQYYQNDYLASRLLYLVTNVVTSAQTSDDLEHVSQQTGFAKLVEEMGKVYGERFSAIAGYVGDSSSTSISKNVLLSSASIKGPNRRLPISAKANNWEKADAKNVEQADANKWKQLTGVDLASDTVPLFETDALDIQQGVAASTLLHGKPSCTSEFVYFSQKLDNKALNRVANFPDSHLSSILLLKEEKGDEWKPIIVPSIVRNRNNEFLDISINCFGYFANLSQTDMKLKICVVGYKD